MSSSVVALVTDGVSATGLTTRLAVSVAEEKAVVPPLLVVSAERAAAAAGLVPGAEGDGVGQRAVVVGVGLEVEPRAGVRRQQTGVYWPRPHVFQFVPPLVG